MCFALQIYCDFSGYTDIALGVARMMGYELRVNFQQPYFSRTIGEFWHRWHISLSTWFRDYVYIPLGGNRVGAFRFYLNLMIVFLLSGLWHGANWTFLIWGGLHGGYIVFGHATSGVRGKLKDRLGIQRVPILLAILQAAWTFAVVCFAWIFFRAPTASVAIYIVRHLLPLGHFDGNLLLAAGMARAYATFFVFFVLTLAGVEWLIMHPHRTPSIWKYRGFRYACYYACLFSIIFFGVFGHTDFIYFQF